MESTQACYIKNGRTLKFLIYWINFRKVDSLFEFYLGLTLPLPFHTGLLRGLRKSGWWLLLKFEGLGSNHGCLLNTWPSSKFPLPLWQRCYARHSEDDHLQCPLGIMWFGKGFIHLWVLGLSLPLWIEYTILNWLWKTVPFLQGSPV